MEHPAPSLRSEIRGVLPFWSGILCGLLIGFLAADLIHGLDTPPPTPAPPVTNTIIREKTIMPAWMRDGKILTTADGKAVLVCDECPCDDSVGTVEVGCCPEPVAEVLHATIESDCPDLDGIQFALTWSDETEQWEGEPFSFCGDTWHFNLVCHPNEPNFSLIRFAPCEGEGPSTGSSIETFECDPFEWTFRFLPFDSQAGYCWRSESQCCAGSEDFHVIITE